MAVLTEDQTMLQDMAASWVRDRAPLQLARKLHHEPARRGAYPELYAEMVEMGWTGVLVPEEMGGVALGHRTMGVILEQLGRNLVASPFLETALGAVDALLLAGSAEQRCRWLPEIVAGACVAAFAIDEGARHAPSQTVLAAVRDTSGWRLDGIKRPVFGGMAADLAVVAARTAGKRGDRRGLTLFLIETGGPGLDREQLHLIDAQDAAAYRFDGFHAPADAVLGTVDDGADLLDALLDRLRIGQAAEMLGAATHAFEITLDYLKTRVQFGQRIGAFQALQHRAAELYSELELARSVVEVALDALDTGGTDLAGLASIAKAIAGDSFNLVAREMIQLHGGIGMTEEHDAGLFFKRAAVADMRFGNAAFHRERFGALAGY